ncbi:MAG: hypothetical protein GF329_17060 [Candidatus Lokiarchaeota archaeon]|nr:hypothetical protein [Candidatus Lokiarchaeota archaeon]
MSTIEKPPYRKPIIFYGIIIGLAIANLVSTFILHRIAGWSLSISGLIGLIVLGFWGITIPIILIILDIVGFFIHDKVSTDFEYLPLIFGLANAILSGIAILIGILASVAVIFDGLTPLHIPYFGFYLTDSILALAMAGVAVGSLVYGIKIARWET